MSHTPEGKIKDQGRAIYAELESYGFPVNQGGLGIRGIPDDVNCVCGVFVHTEYKAEMLWTGTKSAFKTLPTFQQCKRMGECRESGGITLAVDKNNIEFLRGTIDDITGLAKEGCSPKLIQYLIQRTSLCAWNWGLDDYMAYKEGKLKPVLIGNRTIPHPKGVYDE